MKANEITTALDEAISALARVARHYVNLSESQQKAIRHHLYQRHGSFAKPIVQGSDCALLKIARADFDLVIKQGDDSITERDLVRSLWNAEQLIHPGSEVGVFTSVMAERLKIPHVRVIEHLS